MHAVLSPQRINVLGIYADPFVNYDCGDPGLGMRQSYGELHRLFDRLPTRPGVPFIRGADRWVTGQGLPVPSPAIDHLIEMAMSRDPEGPPLLVVGIGAATNIASALMREPELMSRITVVRLGGHAQFHPVAQEFNLMQDIDATRYLLDCGCPLVRISCVPVAQMLRTTLLELRQYLAGRNPLCDFLIERVSDNAAKAQRTKKENNAGHAIAYSKELWDVTATAWLIDPAWAPSRLIASPVLSWAGTWRWSRDESRHLIREVSRLDRDAVLGDLYTKLANATHH